MSVHTDYVLTMPTSLPHPPHEATPTFKDPSFLRVSIHKKFLLLCLMLISLMTISISTVYFMLTSNDKQRLSQQHIQVAFDLLLHGIVDNLERQTKSFEEFTQHNQQISKTAFLYAEQARNAKAVSPLASYTGASLIFETIDALKNFARIAQADRLVLYGEDASIIALYQSANGKEDAGVSTISHAGNQTYVALEDLSRAMQMFSGGVPIPDALFPAEIPTHFYGAIPRKITVNLFHEDHRFGVRVAMPIFHLKSIVGVLIGDVFYTQAWVDEFAALTQTEINLFIQQRLSMGSLPIQTNLPDFFVNSAASMTLQELLQHKNDMPITMHIQPIVLGRTSYYQGAFTLLNQNGAANTITVSVSKESEAREIRRVLGAVLGIAGVMMSVSLGLSAMFSHRTLQAIQQLVNVMGLAASGNLCFTAPVMARDEFGLLAVKLNEMISRLRNISQQTLSVSHAVTNTSDTILTEMRHLFSLMQGQSQSVDHTAAAVEQINQFIDGVVVNITYLLDVTKCVLTSIQAMSASTEMVAENTGDLERDLQEISSFVENVSRTAKCILAEANGLLEHAQTTQREMQRTGALFLTVSDNANASNELARETAEAAIQAQQAMTSSLEGVSALKRVVEQSAHIMRTVKMRSTEINSVLDIVNDIAERTTLLSLNASILSAQAKEHGHGFAVVAQEIRHLSAQTKTSTQEITRLILSLQREAAQGVNSVNVGLRQADQCVQLAQAVKDALAVILARATQSSSHAADTARVVRQALDNETEIFQRMETATAMTTTIQENTQRQEEHLNAAVEAIERIGAMSTQVKQTNIQQNVTADYIETEMERLSGQLSEIASQTQQLQHNSDQIVSAMRHIDAVTDRITHHTTTMSEQTMARLIGQADALQDNLRIFKFE